MAGERAKLTTRSLAHLTASKQDVEAHGERRDEMSLTCLKVTVSKSMVSVTNSEFQIAPFSFKRGLAPFSSLASRLTRMGYATLFVELLFDSSDVNDSIWFDLDRGSNRIARFDPDFCDFDSIRFDSILIFKARFDSIYTFQRSRRFDSIRSKD